MTKKTKRTAALLSAAAVLAVTFAIASQQELTLKIYTIKSKKITRPVRLAHLSDLHSTRYGKKQAVLTALLAEQRPDAVVMTGDMADDHIPHDGIRELLEQIGSVYPCYYVAGNHEFWSGEIEEIKKMFRSYNVTVLEGESHIANLNGQDLCIGGVDDPSLSLDDRQGDLTRWRKQLENCGDSRDDSIFSLLLSHRPERVTDYQHCGFDLILCGHAHGGQVRIPGLVDGLFAPDQGLFPSYAGGLYQLENNAVMIVSRGLMRDSLPRIFNPPELVVINLEPDTAL